MEFCNDRIGEFTYMRTSIISHEVHKDFVEDLVLKWCVKNNSLFITSTNSHTIMWDKYQTFLTSWQNNNKKNICLGALSAEIISDYGLRKFHPENSKGAAMYNMINTWGSVVIEVIRFFDHSNIESNILTVDYNTSAATGPWDIPIGFDKVVFDKDISEVELFLYKRHILGDE